jgi:hypothetical protein
VSLQHEALEVVKQVYVTERGVSFPEDVTYIFWQNPELSPEHQFGLTPLRLSHPGEPFEVVNARLIVGWSGDSLCVTPTVAINDNDTFAENFLSKFAESYEKHDHQVCLEGVRRATDERRMGVALYAHRDKRTGEILRP